MPVTIIRRVRSAGIALSAVSRVVAETLRQTRCSRAHVSVHFVGDRRMRSLNLAHRGRHASADVLSFPLSGAPRERMPFGQEDVGDVFLCVPYLRRQARRFGVPYHEECIRMLIHGILHLAGYDHMTSRGRRTMFGRQESLVRRFVPGARRRPPPLFA